MEKEKILSLDTVKLHEGSLTTLEKTGGDTTVFSRGKMWGGAWLASMSRAGAGHGKSVCDGTGRSLDLVRAQQLSASH